MSPTYVATPLALLPASSYIVTEPYGVVLIIGPFNYPFQLTIFPLLAAIAAGNCVIIKPSELTQATSKLFADLVPRYLDNSAISVVEGAVEETSILLKQPIDFIFFTGSEAVAKIICRAAAERLIPVVLELGGKSPVIVDNTADLLLAARRIMWGKLLNAGQSCIAPDYVYVHHTVKQEFIDLCKQQIIKFYGQDIKNSKDYGRIVNERHVKRLQGLLNGIKNTNEIKVGGQIDLANKYVAPTIVDTTIDSTLMTEEIFGPILPIIEYTDISTVLNYINSRPKALSLYIFSNDKNLQDRILKETSSGGMCINDVMFQYANHNLPFGGVGNSGIGSYHGKNGYLMLSHSKSILDKATWGDAPARYPPYTDGNYKLFRYIAEIYRINSSTIESVLKYVLVPIIVGVIMTKLGVSITYKSRL